MVSRTSVRTKLFLAFSFLLLLLLLSTLHYLLTFLLDWNFSIFLLILIILLSIRALSYAIIFPGSSLIWKKSLEYSFCSQLCIQGTLKIQSISSFLSSLTQPKILINYASLKSASNFINQVLAIYSTIPLNATQARLKSLLDSLKSSLELITIQDKRKRQISAWRVLLTPDKIRRTNKLTGLTDPSESLKLCEEISALLQEENQFSLKKFLFGEYILGGIDYQRSDFIERFKPESFFLTGINGNKIDCVWINSEKSNNDLAVVYCAPNGGLYEYIFYQTDWVEFYLEIGASIMLWNYRGYGRSEGSPKLSRLCSDGEIVMNYVKVVKKAQFIIIHGESMGGAVAAAIAEKSQADLLVADRTFASLFKVVRSYAGFIMAGVVSIVGPSSHDNARSFFNFPKPKILTCDPKDSIIDDSASLKCGIASILKPPKHVDKSLVSIFKSSLKKINLLKTTYAEIQSTSSKQMKFVSKKQAQKTLNTEENEWEIDNLVLRFLEIACKLDSGGYNLIDLIEIEGDNCEAWLDILEVWGSGLSPHSSDVYDPKDSAVEKLNSFVRELSQLIHEFTLSSQLVSEALIPLNEILKVASIVLGRVENKIINDSRAGELMIVECGHNGSFNSVEKYFFEKLLRKSMKSE